MQKSLDSDYFSYLQFIMMPCKEKYKSQWIFCVLTVFNYTVSRKNTKVNGFFVYLQFLTTLFQGRMQKSVDFFVYLQFLTTLLQGRMQKSVDFFVY